MSAFKVLNLRNISSRIITMLTFLSLGLISLVFSGGGAPPLFELALIISYLAFGDFFLSAYFAKSDKHGLVMLLCSALFVLSLIFNFTYFYFLLKFFSVIICSLYLLSGAYLFLLLEKNSKGAALKLLPHLMLFLYALISSLI